MKILVIGASGFVGQKLLSNLRSCGNELVGTYFHNKCHCLSKLDITNIKAVKELFDIEKPDFVIHAAGIGRPNQFKSDPTMGDAVNVEGTRNVANVCNSRGVSLAYISSAFVFDGAKQTPYLETDPTPPINLYGHSKLKAENIVRKIPNSIILRTDMMYGYNGKGLNNGFFDVIAKVQSRLNLNAEDIRQPLFVDDLAAAIMILLENKSYGIFHLAGKEHLTQFELGLKIEKIIRSNSRISPVAKYDEVSRPKKILMDTTKAKRAGIKFTQVDQAISIMRRQI